MSITEDKSIELKLESTTTEAGIFYFTAKSLTIDFENEPCLERLARDSLNKPLVWRHRHPIEEEYNKTHIYGRVVESNVVDGSIISKYEVYNHTEDHLKLIDLIKERAEIDDPLGISMHYRKYYKNNEITHLDVFEHSSTPFPACPDCLYIDDYMGEKEMPEKEKEKNEKDEAEDEFKSKVELEEHLKKIKELESALDAKTKSLEEFEAKIEKLEKAIEKQEQEKEQETMSLEDKVKTLEEKLEKQEEDYTGKIDYLTKKPILDELFELRDLDDDEKEFYKSYSLVKLQKKKDEWAKESTKPVTSSMEDSVAGATSTTSKQAQGSMKEEVVNEDDMKSFLALMPKSTREKVLEHLKNK